MQARMKNPAIVIPEAMPAIQALYAAHRKGRGSARRGASGPSARQPDLNRLRFLRRWRGEHARKAGETDDRLFAVAAWRDTPYFTDRRTGGAGAERGGHSSSDRSDPVPDAIWDEAAKHYDEKGLAALLFVSRCTNVFNRLNVATRQPAGAGW